MYYFRKSIFIKFMESLIKQKIDLIAECIFTKI